MKKVIIFLFSLFVFLVPRAVYAADSEQITRYDVNVTVVQDGTINVTEKIDYLFPSPRHGIFRDIPVIKSNADGKKYRMALSNISVTDENGAPYSFTQSASGDNEQLKIGDANRTITGSHRYVVSYTVSGALTYFPGHDELYWNPIGTSWQVPVSNAITTVTLPVPIARADLNASCFVGAQGQSAADCTIAYKDDAVTVTVARPLEAYEGVSVVVGFPKGIVAVLEPKELVPFSVTPAAKILFLLLGVAAFAWYIAAPLLVIRKWWTSGRDPKPAMGEVSAWFSPPKTQHLRDLTPAETGSLVDETVDLKDIYASLVDLARRGYMKIIETKKGIFDFQKVKDWNAHADKSIQPFEKTLLSAIFADKNRVALADLDLIATFSTVKTQIYDSLVSDGFFPENPQKVRTLYYVLAGFAFVTGNFILFLVALIFGKNMPRKTAYGSQQAAMAKSLKNFLVSQERELKFQASKQMMFEKLLPYAIAFGVEEIWAARFADLGLKQPNWYVSPSGSAFNTVVFAQSLSRGVTMSFAQSVTTRSSTGFSSGFSGGGFSGGGGGGGGGGSW
jgi:hypothetical protein